VPYKEIPTKNKSDYADFIRFHFNKNAKVQLLFVLFMDKIFLS